MKDLILAVGIIVYVIIAGIVAYRFEPTPEDPLDLLMVAFLAAFWPLTMFLDGDDE